MDMEKTQIGITTDDERTQMVSAPAGNATQMAMSIECPVCRTSNPPSETYCIDCGFLLASAPVAAGEVAEVPSTGKLVSTDGTREFPLNPGANTVGRENADVLLSHNTVSRKHATITVENGHAYAEDAGSTNGTAVSGTKIAPGERTELTNGCEVMFGSLTLKYEAPAQAAPAEAEAPAEEASEPTQMISTEAPAEETPTQEPSSEPTEQLFDLEPVASETPSPGGEGWGEGTASETPSPGGEGLGEGATAESPSPGGEGAACVGKLVAKDGSMSFDIRPGTSKVGRRDGENDIVIPDPYCSGRHADLSCAAGAFTLTDIGSTNGTMVNGVKLEAYTPHEIHAGDEITLGRTTYRLEVA